MRRLELITVEMNATWRCDGDEADNTISEVDLEPVRSLSLHSMYTDGSLMRVGG